MEGPCTLDTGKLVRRGRTRRRPTFKEAAISCIAGTPLRPLRWIRFTAGEPVELEGRWCDRTEPYTNRQACSSCPAYRGVRWDGTTSTGVAPNGEPIGLTLLEYSAWLSANEAALVDDDFSLLGAWAERMSSGMGTQALARIGDPIALRQLADRVAAWRANNRERKRELDRKHARAYRARKRATVSNDCQAVETGTTS